MNHTITVIRRHWLPLLALNSLLMAATFYAAIIYADRAVAPVWKADAKLNLPKRDGKLNADLGTLGNISDGNVAFSKETNPLAIQSAILTSDAVMERVLATDPEKNLYSALADYKELFTIEPQDQTTFLLLQAEGSSPTLSLARVRNLVASYQERLNELRRQDAEFREHFAQKELKKAKNDLIQAQNKLSNFQQTTNLINAETQTRALVEAMQELKTQQTQLIAQAQASEEEVKIAAQNGITPKNAIHSVRLAENKEYQNLRDQLSQTEAELAAVRSIFTDETPQAQSLLFKRDELQRQLNQQIAKVVPNGAAEDVDTTLADTGQRVEMIADYTKLKIEAEGLRQQAKQVQNRLDKFNDELKSISQNQVPLLELQRQYDIAEGVYKGIVAQVSQTKINTFDTYPNVQLIDGPTLNPQPKTANRKLIVLGGFLASIFGSLSLIQFLESRNPLLSPKDIQQAAIPLVVSLPRLKVFHLNRKLEPQAEREFQRLASILSSLVLENQRLMITSSTFGEGKTTVTLGLALALFKLGFRVLVVDGDLRQAELSRRLGYSRREREEKHKETVVPIYPNFDLMLAPLIPIAKIGAFVARGDFERRLSMVQESGNYDYVLIDSAPVSLAFETSLMSTLAHNLLFIIRPGISNRYSVMDSLEQLKLHNVQIKSLIVNGVEKRRENYRYYGNQAELLEAEV